MAELAPWHDRTIRAFAIAALQLAVAPACSTTNATGGSAPQSATVPDASGPPVDSGPLDSGAQGATVVGPGGGTVTTRGIAVTIQPGALDHDVIVSITPIASPVAGAVGPVFEIGPTGTQFKTPVTIALAYTVAELGGAPASTFAVSTVVGDAWRPLASPAIDPASSTLSGTTVHLSPYALAPIPDLDAGDAAVPSEAGLADGPTSDAAPVEAGVTEGGTSAGDAGCGTATASFASDVVPIFRNGCSLTSVCHGQMNNANEENLYLGDNAGTAASSTIRARLVGVASVEDPSMNLVTANDTAHSYLWHKVIGDQNSNAAVASGCAQALSACVDCTTSAPCGAEEPYLSAPLASSELCVLQRWIDQGALDN